MDSDDIIKMLVEIETGKPHSVQMPGAEAMYAQLQKECDDIHAKGGTVEVPHEIPDVA